MKNGTKIAIIVISIIVIAVLLYFAVLAFPLRGKANNELWLSTQKYTDDYAVSIEKSPNKDFKILVLSDIQLSDLLDSFGQSKMTYDTIEKLITGQKPDLIVLTGDTVWLPFTKFSTLDIVKFLDSFKIPWAPINGNHDPEGTTNINWICDQYVNSEYCIFKKGPSNIGGIGNYIINIKENDKTIQTLFMLDSHSMRQYEDKKGYDFIYESQMSWYKWAVNGIKELNDNQTVPSMVFQHIPLPEYKTAYEMWEKSGFDEKIGFGKKNEGECCPPVNSGFFNVLKDMESTKYVFSGHDHVNSYSVLYDGIRLSYGLKTGDRCYNDDTLNGGTLITIGDKINVEHIFCVD
ncbi:MAG: metallophosphoesterase family protein [Oscillospiraceae bacterium]